MLTENEKKLIRLLMISSEIDYSINEIARECKLSPNGAYKMLRKFEKEGILKSKAIANIKSYRIDFDNEKTTAVLELALMQELKGRIKYRMEDFKNMKQAAKACVLFGSYSDLKKEPNDIDVLFIIDDYKKYKKTLEGIKDIVPAKIHDVVQTEEDLKKNIIKKDKIIIEILKKGAVLWGHEIIVQAIKYGQ